MSIILGIDPGSRSTGFGVIKVTGQKYHYLTSGCIKTSQEDMANRLLEVYEGVNHVIRNYCPSQVAIEKVFVNKNVDSALKLGHARGAAFVAIASHAIPINEYTPRMIKKTIVGYGAADKQQIQQMVKILLRLSDIPQQDAADALAIAICHANHTKGLP